MEDRQVCFVCCLNGILHGCCFPSALGEKQTSMADAVWMECQWESSKCKLFLAHLG